MSPSQVVTKLPDDVFRAQLRDVLAHLRTWTASMDDVARIESAQTDSYWRLESEPVAQYACPFELIVHADQRFDLLVGPESYESCPIGTVKLLSQLVEAIGDGRVITRLHVSRNTGAVRSVETVIAVQGGGTWRNERLNQPLASAIHAQDCQAHDRLYVPYRRI